MKTGTATIKLLGCPSTNVVEGIYRSMLECLLAPIDEYWSSMRHDPFPLLSFNLSGDNGEKPEMTEELDRAVKEAESINTPLIILTGSSRHHRGHFLAKYASYKNLDILNIGLVFGQHLASSDEFNRRSNATEILEKICADFTESGLLIVDNIEILFDQTLALNPMSVLKKISRNRAAIVVWPGDVKNGRLQYATPNHPEFQDHSIDGVVLFNCNMGEQLDALQ